MAADDETMADTQSQEQSKSTLSAAEGSSQATANSSGSTSQGAKGTTWNTKKWQEEYEVAKSRLSDQKFSSADYPDPFAPRAGVHPKAYPNGTTVELEQKLKGLVEKIRAKDA